jgi:3-methyladenine DNA glycosylase AlkD
MKIFLPIILLFSNFSLSQIKKKIDTENCSYNGKKLFGKVKIVDSFPDIKVKIVNSFPDLKVKIVDAFPDKCGEWQIVDSFPDVKIKFVEKFPDLKIMFVENFPGIP